MSKYLVTEFKDNPCWHAKWISVHNSENIINYYFRARTRFQLSEIHPDTLLHIAAESYYLLYVNGIEVGRGPARGTHKYNYYDSYNVASLLQTGCNIIAVLVQCMNYDTFIAAPVQPGVIVEITGVVDSDAAWEVSQARDWRRDVESYSIQVGHCEWRDLRLEPKGWTIYQDFGDWESAREIPQSSKIWNKKLLPRTIPALKENTMYPVDIPIVATVSRTTNLNNIEISKLMAEELYSFINKEQVYGLSTLYNQFGYARITPLADNSGITIIFDFAATIVGRFELELTAPQGTVVDICHNESIKKDRLAVSHSHNSYHFVDRYILRQGRQKIGNSVHDRGFRMVQIVLRNFTESIIIHEAKAIDNRYPFTQRAYFNCNDLLLNRIWAACCETLKPCITDVFTDCPWRERSFWVNDLVVENITSLQAFGCEKVHKRAFQMAFSEVLEEGILPGVCPCPENLDHFVLVPTSLFIIIMLKDYLMYSGDRELIKESWPYIISILETFNKWEDKHGFILPPGKYRNFFDWGFEANGISFNNKKTSLLNYLYIMAMKSTIKLAKFAGKRINNAKYENNIKKISGNLEKYFFKENGKRLADWLENDVPSTHSSQLAHAFALLSGEYSQDKRKSLEDALSDNNLLMPELYLHYFIFHAMLLCGKEEEGLERIRKYWGAIVNTGSPTIWEAGVYKCGKEAFGGDGSLCHGFSTSPIDFFQTVILGIRPISPGFETFKVEPRTLGLNFVEGRVPTPHGNIYLKWKRIDAYLEVELRVPPKTVAEIKNGENYSSGNYNFKLKLKRDEYA